MFQEKLGYRTFAIDFYVLSESVSNVIWNNGTNVEDIGNTNVLAQLSEYRSEIQLLIAKKYSGTESGNSEQYDDVGTS